MSENLKNGEFYANGDVIFRARVETKTDTGESISLGFPVCEISEYVSADNLVECLNASRHYDALVKALIDTLCELTACANQLTARGLKGHEGDSVSRAQVAARSALASIKEQS